jgi:hypothetical protein
MNLFTFVQAIVSIAFIYLVLSLFTSEIQEYLAAIFESRAKRLKQSIRQMLGEQDYPLLPLKVDNDIKSGKNIWIDPNGAIKEIPNTVGNDKYIYVEHKEAEKYEVVDQPIELIQDVINRNSNYYYKKGLPVKRDDIHTLFQTIEVGGKIWEKNGKLRVIKPEDIGKIVDQHIWISNQDNSPVDNSQIDADKTVENKSSTPDTSNSVTKYPVYTNLGTSPINSGAKVWLNQDQGTIKDVSIPEKNSNYIYINQDDGSEFQEKEVIEDATKLGQFYTVGAIIIKTPVYKITEDITDSSSNSYALNFLDGTLVNQAGKSISNKLESDIIFPVVGSLTEKLYQHRNIQALNQSGFDWVYLFSPSKKYWEITYYAWLFLLSPLAVVIWVWITKEPIDPRWILGILFVILGILSYLLNRSEVYSNTKTLGRTRRSVGPSYIDADIFANTLLDVLRYNTMRGVDNETKRLSTLFYTPAKSILGQWLQELDTDGDGDVDAKNLVQSLQSKYEKVFDKVQERSSGVYKRNAKGLSFLLGLLLATLLNADTFNFVNKFTQADNKVHEQISELLSTQQIPECQQDPNSVTCSNKFKDFREKFEELNSKNALPLGWNTDTIQELSDEIALLKGEKEIIKTACASSGDDRKCLDQINTLFQNNPKIFAKDGKFIDILKKANSSMQEHQGILQKYEDLQNEYQTVVKDKTRKINEIVINNLNSVNNLNSGNKKDLSDLQKDLDALNSLQKCNEKSETSGKECFAEILNKLNDDKFQAKDKLQRVINENNYALLNKLQQVHKDNAQESKPNLEELKKKYTDIISEKEKEQYELAQAQEPTIGQVHIVVERQGGWLRVLFGWLITAIAISMGAPFWFDLIGRIINVRNAHKPGKTR